MLEPKCRYLGDSTEAIEIRWPIPNRLFLGVSLPLSPKFFQKS